MPVTITLPTKKTLPVGNCVEVCFNTDELIETPGELISFNINFQPAFVDHVGIGTLFSQSFEFGLDPNSFGYFNTLGTPETVAANFVAMINQYFYISSNFIVEVDPNDLSRVLISAKCLIDEEKPYITIFPMDNGGNIILTLNDENVGEFPKEVDGYRLFYQMYCSETEKPLCKSPSFGYFPYNAETEEVFPICIDLSHTLKDFVNTPIPLVSDAVKFTSNSCKSIYFLYGAQTSQESCGMETTATFRSDDITVLASACQLGGSFEEYCGDTLPVKFLTCQRGIRPILDNYPQWLHIYSNRTEGDFIVGYEYLLGGQTVGTVVENIPAEKGFLQIPIKPEDFPQNHDKIKVTVFHQTDNTFQTYSEEVCFEKSNLNECKDVFYFKCSKGGYDILSCFETDLEQLEITSEQYCSIPDCGDLESELSEGFLGTVGKTSFSSLNFTGKFHTNQDREQLREFMGSSEFFRVVTVNGDQYSKKFVIDPDSYTISRREGTFTVNFSGRYTENFNTI